MNRDVWVPWICWTLVFLGVGALAGWGSYSGDPKLTAGIVDLMKVMVGAFFGFLGGRHTSGRQSAPRGTAEAVPPAKPSRSAGKEVKT
jgi:hypothetical protein